MNEILNRLPARFTGTVTSPVTTDPRTGEECRQVFEYERGECTDRYVTIIRHAGA